MVDLLSPLLLLISGLVLLLSEAHCHGRHSDCNLLVYLDSGFSLVSVFVLLSSAAPELRRYGLLVLQAAPLNLPVAQVHMQITEIQGVLSVHELHLWQLSDELTVASVHVYCSAGMSARDCEDLIAGIRAALAGLGVAHCTVQPEFIAPCGDDSVPAACSLSCGKECVGKLCCSPQDNDSLVFTKLEERRACVQEKPCPEEIGDVVIENTYL